MLVSLYYLKYKIYMGMNACDYVFKKHIKTTVVTIIYLSLINHNTTGRAWPQINKKVLLLKKINKTNATKTTDATYTTNNHYLNNPNHHDWLAMIDSQFYLKFNLT